MSQWIAYFVPQLGTNFVFRNTFIGIGSSTKTVTFSIEHTGVNSKFSYGSHLGCAESNLLIESFVKLVTECCNLGHIWSSSFAHCGFYTCQLSGQNRLLEYLQTLPDGL